MGGGGGSSGRVSYSPYLESAHSNFIGSPTLYVITQNLFQTVNTMMASSPYSGSLAFDPDIDLAAMISAISVYDSHIDTLMSDDQISADVAAFSDILDSDINSKVIPSFNARMRDIGAVQSSAFAIGAALIWAGRDREVAKYETSLVLKREDLGFQGKKDVMHYSIESHRMSIAAKSDEAQINNELDVNDAGWDLECILKGSQVLGVLGGGTHLPDKPSKMASAVSGALSGAAIGAMTGSPAGAVVGGLLGAASSFLQ